MSTLASIIMNGLIAWGGKEGEEKKFTVPLDFMPDWDGDEKEVVQQSVEEQKRILTGMARDRKKRVRKEGNMKPSKRGPPIKREI